MAKICLDAGHGGSDPGACGYGRKEKDDVLKVVKRVGTLLKEKGHSIYYTRTNDIYESPTQKAKEANSAGVVFFASFHRNSAANVAAHGYETLVYADKDLAKKCADAANETVGGMLFKENRGTKLRPDLTVLNTTTMQAVLFEIGFISNSGDNDIFDSRFEEICQQLANAIIAAVGGDKVSGGSGSEQKIPTAKPSDGKKDLGHVDITYQAYTTKWWAPVKNQEDWAGKGDNTPIRYLAVKVSKGKIKGRVYTKKSGWLPYLTFGNSYNTKDFENGCLGDGSDILAVELYYYTPEGYEYKEVHYRVSPKNDTGYYSVQVDNKKGNGFDGYAGDKKNYVDKFQAWIE